MKALSIFALTLVFSVGAYANDTGHPAASKYAGQELRNIKSLSSEDLEELRRGGGWGMAKAAELNGVPGPAHLLELKGDIPLDATQEAAIIEIFMGMKSQAIKFGKRLIDLERQLDTQFHNGTVTDASLRKLLDEIEKARRALRYTHLATHLKTVRHQNIWDC